MALKLLKCSIDICWYLALALPVLSYLPGWGVWVFWGLPLIYAVALLISRREYGSHGGNLDALKWQGGILLAGGLFEWWIMGLNSREESMLFACLFLALGTLLLRVSRLGEEARKDRRFWIQNVIHIAGVAALVLLATSQLFLGGVSQVAGFIYTYIISPVVLGLAWVLGKLLGGILEGLYSLLPQADGELFSQNITVPEALDMEQLSFNKTEIPPLLTYIAWGLLAMVVLLALRIIYKRLVSAAGKEKIKGGAVIKKTALPPAGEKKSPGWTGDPVRGYYRRFLRLCKRRGILRLSHESSRELQEKASARWSIAELSPLRELYISARYHAPSTGKQAAMARREYHKLKSGGR